MATETELKLALDPAQRRRLLRQPLLAAATRLGTKKLVNVYYDTPDLALKRRGVALRLRRDGRQWLQTVKCAGEVAGGLSARPEWEQPYDGADFDFSGIEDEPLRRWLERSRIRRRLVPVFETTFTRQSWRHVPSPGVAILLMLDAGAIASGGKSAPISELELELAEGSPDELMSLARQLAAGVALRPEPLSKAQRGYLLYAGIECEPQKAGASPLTPRHDIAGGFRAVALDCLTHLQANEAGARESLHPEFIHQMRVALRRLRSALRVFAPALAPEAAAAIAREIGELANRLGAARDWDVLAEEILAPVCAAFPDDERLKALTRAVAEHREAGQAAARATIDHPDYGRLMLDLLAFCHAPATVELPGADGKLQEFARRQVAGLRERLRKRAKRATDLDIVALHRLRIAAKRLRYALEFFAPLLSEKRLRRCLKHMTALQDDLGLLNDLANAGRVLAECAGTDPSLREAIALIAGWYGPRHREILARLPDEIRTLVRQPAF